MAPSSPALHPLPPHRPGGAVPFHADEVEGSLGARFERVAAARPDGLALRWAGRSLTYAELTGASGAVARVIRDRLGEARAPVALYMRQGADAVAAVLGAARAGVPYVPLDPDFPPDRTASILAQAAPALLLADADLKEAACAVARGGCHVETAPSAFAAAPDAFGPSVDVGPDALAYVLYTSGSTGEPKGVMQTHRNVLFDMQRQCHDLGTSPADRFGMLFHPSSSASVCHLFGALLAGATVCPFSLRASGLDGLARWLLDERITVLDINVATFRALADAIPHDARFPAMRIFAPGSEPVYRRDLDAFHRHFGPGCVMQNSLGTTETRTVTQVYLDHASAVEGERVPVGYPVEGKAVRLVGPDGREAPPGEPGEIVVESRYLSPGYWNRPDLTARAFDETPAGRRYRTGDLGVRDAAGCIVHLGRKDFQVKIRGHRVEVPEVEAAVRALPGVEEAVVVARPDARGETQLVAFVVTHGAPEAGAWRRSLGETLPAHMVPGHFERLEALPLTLNGKLNRRALVERPLAASPPPTYDALRTPMEHRLAAVWAEVLGVEAVDREAHFFDDLGGHSLLAASLAIQIEAATDRAVRIVDLYDHPTLAALAASLDALPPSEPVGPALRALADAPDDAPAFFCAPGIEGSAQLLAPLADRLAPDVALHAFDFEALPDDSSIEALAASFVEAIRAVQPAGPYRIGGFSLGGTIAFEAAQQLRRAGQTIALLVLLDAGFPYRPLAGRLAGHLCRAQALGPAGYARHLVATGLTRVRWGTRLRTARARDTPDDRLDVRRATVAGARREYRPDPYPAPVLLLRSTDADTQTAKLWARVCPSLETRVVADDHMIVREPHLEAVAGHLLPALTAPRTPAFPGAEVFA